MSETSQTKQCPACFAQNPANVTKCEKCGASLMNQLLEEALHPAGGINSRFVYEPIGFGEYAYKNSGEAHTPLRKRRNVAMAKPIVHQSGTSNVRAYLDPNNRRMLKSIGGGGPPVCVSLSAKVSLINDPVST